MTYTNPLNWTEMEPAYRSVDAYRLISSDSGIEYRTLITKTRRGSGSWKVEVSVNGMDTRDALFTDDLRVDQFVRRVLKNAGFTESQVATFELPMDEPETLDVSHPNPLGEEWTPMAGYWVRPLGGYRVEVLKWGSFWKARALSEAGDWTLPTAYGTPEDAAEALEAYVIRNPLTVATTADPAPKTDDPDNGYVYDPDELDQVRKVLPITWVRNPYGTRTLKVCATDPVGGLTVLAIEIPRSPTEDETKSSQWTLVVRDRDQPEVLETYISTPAQMARVMRRVYIGRSI